MGGSEQSKARQEKFVTPTPKKCQCSNREIRRELTDKLREIFPGEFEVKGEVK